MSTTKPLPLFEIVEGWGAELGPFTLKDAGVPFELPAAVDVIIVGQDGAAVDTTDWVRVADDQASAGKGQVYFTPDPSKLKYLDSPYSIRWRVPGAPDQEPVFVPNGAPDTFRVYRP